jgi:chromosome partitioning protein
MTSIALYSIKGGVGKTAAAVNLTYLAAESGAPTLLIDLDPQSAATFYFRIRTPKKHSQDRLIRGGKKMEKNIRETDFPLLHLLPADFSYRNLDITLDGMKRSKKRLKELLQSLKDEYRYVFFDCPPNITLVSENVFVAADIILLPVIPTILSMRTYETLLRFFSESGQKAGKIWPYFSMVEKRKKMHGQMMEETGTKGDPFLENYIPYLSEVEKMGLYRAPLVYKKPASVAAQAYRRLWEEIKVKDEKEV